MQNKYVTLFHKLFSKESQIHFVRIIITVHQNAHVMWE